MSGAVLRTRLEPATPRLRHEWRALAAELAAPPFLRPGWFSRWEESFGRSDLPVLTARAGERLVGVVPLTRRAGVWCSPTNWHTPLFDLLTASALARDALTEALLRQAAPVLSLGFLDGESESVAGLRAAGRAQRCRIVEHVQEHPPRIQLSGDWDDYCAGRDRRMLAEVRRRERRLDEQGCVRLEVLEDAPDLDRRLADGFAVEARGWKGRQGTAVRSEPEAVDFYRALAHWAAPRGWLRLAFLWAGPHIVAFDYALEAGGVHYLLKTGYDEDFARFAPGKILRRRMVERAFSEQLRIYDFCGRDEPWKREWTDERADRIRLRAFADGALGRGAARVYAGARPALQRLARRVRPEAQR